MARIIHFPKKLPYLGLTYFWLLYYGVGTHSSSSCSRRRYAFNDLMDDNGSDDNDSSNSCSGIASDFLTLLRQFHKVRRYRRRRARLRTVVLGKWRPYVAKSYAESVTEDLKLRLDEFLSFWACRAPNFVYACRLLLSFALSIVAASRSRLDACVIAGWVQGGPSCRRTLPTITWSTFRVVRSTPNVSDRPPHV